MLKIDYLVNVKIQGLPIFESRKSDVVETVLKVNRLLKFYIGYIPAKVQSDVGTSFSFL